MNERIKQLALQAGLVRNGDIGMKRWEGPRSDSISDQDLEKFAELIVRECAEWIKNTDSDPDIGEEDAHALLQHFGVEE